MKNYNKAEAIRIITTAAAEYETLMRDKQFLIAYQDSSGFNYSIVGFKAMNFKHFTGVVSDLPSKVFYRRALEHKLSPDDFRFDLTGNAHRKLTVLPWLSKMFFSNALRGSFNRSGIRLEADYLIGGTSTKISVAFRYGKTFDVPVSLYCEDVRNLTNDSTKVLAVWRRAFGEKVFSENTYCAKNINPEMLLSNLELN